MEKDNVLEQKEFSEVYNYCYDDKFNNEDLESRRIYLNGCIDEEAISTIVYHILRYNRIDEGLAKDERKPIILYINSPGGSVVEGYGVIDAITTSETPVYTVNLALCASMGFLIYIAGEKRYSMPHAEFLLHDGSTFGYDSTAKMKDRMEFETVQLENMTKEYILARTKIDKNLYNEKYRCEWYFLPNEGKKIGAVDCIIGIDCKMGEIL